MAAIFEGLKALVIFCIVIAVIVIVLNMLGVDMNVMIATVKPSDIPSVPSEGIEIVKPFFGK